MRAYRGFLPLLALFLLVLTSPSDAAAASPGRVLFEGAFDVQELQWTQDEDGYAVPVLPQTRTLADPGDVDLPVREFLFVIPLESEVADVTIEPLSVHVEKVPGQLAVAGPHLTDSGDAIVADPAKASLPAPAMEWGKFTGTQIWRGYRLLTLRVSPLRVAEAGQTGALEFLDEFAVRVNLRAATDPVDAVIRQRQVPGEAEELRDTLRRLVSNPHEIAAMNREDGMKVAEPADGFQPTAAPSLLGSAVQFLIITNQEMAPEFQRLADFKTAQGMSTKVVTIEFIQANARQRADLQETIRGFAQDAYELWGTEYLMLGGDTDIIPARYVDNSFYPTIGSTLIPTEIYFAGLDGTWNANGNARYGEPFGTAQGDDLADFAEEVYLGRATVSSFHDATVFVDKVISYESNPVGGNWTNRALFAAEVLFPESYPEDDYITMDGAQFAAQIIEDYLIPCTDMEYLRMFETSAPYERDARLTREALIDTLNTGRYGIVNQIGHGFYFNMSVGNANFMTTDADELVNGDHYFLMYTLNCASAAFDMSCLMERLVQNPNGGSVASIGASRAAFPNTTNSYQQEFFRHLLCQPDDRLGRLVALSRLPWLGSTFENSNDRWTFENYTLLGDPTLRIWTGTPQAAVVTAPAELNVGPASVAVTVEDGSGPVAEATVSLVKDGESSVLGVTDALGQVTLDFLPTSPGTAELTVSGGNLALTTLPIPVTAAGAYLAVSDMEVVDDGTLGSSGNGNQIAEAGETVAYLVTLQETGGSSANGITGTLVSEDARATVLVADANFPNISAGGTVQAAAPVLVQFDADVPDGDELPFLWNIGSGGGGSYECAWSTSLRAPEIEFTVLDWNDSSFGNGSDFIDSGERLALSLSLKNYGSGPADDVTVRLRTSDPNVTLYGDSVVVFHDLAMMESVDLPNSMSLALVNMLGTSDCWLLAEDNHGRTVRHDFSIGRPEVPTGLELDTSLGPDVIAMRWDRALAPDRFGYNIYRSENETYGFVRINPDVILDTTYYADYGLAEFTKYYYRIVTVSPSLIPSGFSETVGANTAPAEAEGFPAIFKAETSGSLAVGDVDGLPGLEIVLGSDEVYVWHHDGSELLDGDGDSQTLGPFTDMSSEFQPAAITLARLDDVAGMEMIVCERPTFQVHIFRKDGTELPGWPQSTTGMAGTSWNWAPPSVGDIDGDGEPEIVVNTLNGVTWAWNVDGSEVRDGDNNASTHGVFYYRPGSAWEWTMSGPTLADLDGDGAKDVIWGTKMDDTGLNRVMAVRYDGTDVPGFPYTTIGDIGGNVSVGDLDRDGVKELVIWDQAKRVYVIQEDGTNYPGFPYYTGIGATMAWVTTPALGDVDADGELEIVWSANETGDRMRVAVIDTDVAGGTSGTMLAGWPVILPGSSESSPLIADINGDGALDVIQGIGGGSEDAPNNLYAMNIDGTDIAGFPITLGGPFNPSATICDLEYDGDLDIVYGGWDMQLHVWDMPYDYDRALAPWPTYKGNMQRTGEYYDYETYSPVEDGAELPPSVFEIGSPYPNPFNPVTKVRLYVPADQSGMGTLELAVYDIKGRRVKVLHSGPIASGWHVMQWDGTDQSGHSQSSGLYFMQAVSGSRTSVSKMTLVK